MGQDGMGEQRKGEAEAFQDHPIFTESLRLIRERLGPSALNGIERELLERLVHTSGDLDIGRHLCFSAAACAHGMRALAARAPILTDTAMAAAAVAPMARRTFTNPVASALDWAPATAPAGSTRAAEGMARALAAWPRAVVLIGSAPTALERLLDLVTPPAGAGNGEPLLPEPALVIGMPVGFVGVVQSKRHLAATDLPQIRLEGTRGGAALAAAAANALLRRAWLDQLA